MQSMSEATRVQRIGHRGAKRELPENTIPAFQRAFERGADAIELDVHATADGVVVVHHDRSLRSAEGGLLEISRTPWAELARVELAPGIGIPRLTDVLAATPAGATVYVEIKGEGIERAVAAVIGVSGVSCAVHSFDHAAVERMQKIAPAIPRGILFEHAGQDVLGAMQRTGARDVWPHWKLVERPLVDLVHEAGGRVLVWTVNDVDVAERLAILGVDGLCGDDVRIFDRLRR